MVTQSQSRSGRPAAVSASTVFAIALAIVAGLIFAWLFKIVLLSPKVVEAKKNESVEITVAAVNLYKDWEIRPLQVKKIRVSKQQKEDILKKSPGKTLLSGNQPIGRVTKVSINADSPIFEEDLEPFTYPVPLDKLLKPGWRAIILTVPAKAAMVQVGDYVDVHCTLSNGALGAGAAGNATAEIAKAAKVIARFGTTRPNAQPAKPHAPRQYTLEVTPRAALIDLAKKMGAKFTLVNVPTSSAASSENGEKVAPVGNDINDDRERKSDLVTVADLEELFGITRPERGPGPWVVEKFVGLKRRGRNVFPNYVPASHLAPAPPVGVPGASPGTTPPSPPKATPAASSGSPTPTTTTGYNTPTRRTTTSRTSFNPRSAVASNTRGGGGGGFKAPVDLGKASKCKT